MSSTLKVAVVSQYYWPEPFIIHELCRRLVDLGAEISVLTGQPNYPSGVIESGYRSHEINSEQHEGVTIHRVPLRARGKATAGELIKNYLSFIWNGCRRFPRIADTKPPDIIFCYAPSPVTSVLPAIWLKWRYRCKLVLWVQDLWPESLHATGFVKNRYLLRLCGWLVAWLYRRCDLLLVPSKAFIEPVSRLAGTTKVVYYPNSYPEPDVSAVAAVSNVECFNVVFAGNFGQAQSLETIIEAAELLQTQQQIQITLVGSGHLSEWLITQKQQRQLNNIKLTGRLPMSEMPAVMANADALLVTLRDEPIFSYTIPSKLQAYLAVGRPIIAALNGEGARIVDDMRAGFTCAAEDSEALANKIQTLSALPDEVRQQMGTAARAAYEANFDMNTQAKKLLALLTKESRS